MTAASPPPPARPGPALIVAALALCAFSLALFAPQILNDGDTLWHIRAGEWMLDHRQVLHHDPFSSSMPGAPWSTHEWLAEILLAAAWRLGDLSAVMLLTAAAFGASVLVLGRALARSLSGTWLAVVLILAVGTMTPFLVARPHILALPLLTVWVVALIEARRRDRTPPWWMAAVIVPWANLHGGYAFGIALAAFFALEALVAARPEARLGVTVRWGIFGLLCVAAALVTPHGLDGLFFPFQLLGLDSLQGITEWAPTSFAEADVFKIALAAIALLALCTPLRLPPFRAVLLVLLAAMALSHVRHQLLFAVIAPLLLAKPIAALVAAPLAERPRLGRPRLGRRWLVGAGILLLSLVVVRLALPAKLREGPMAPINLVSKLPADLLRQPVLNHYDYGGYLIWVGGRPFVDGRADMYGDTFMGRYFALARGDQAALDQALAGDRITWTIAPKGDRLAALMDRQPGWRRLMSDSQAVVHVRTRAAAKAAPIP